MPENDAPPVVSISSSPSAEWNHFVRGHEQAHIYLQSGWSELAREVFGHQALFVEARDGQGALVGILPVVRQRGMLGDFATSIPFFNYGGALANTEVIAAQLMSAARDHVRRLGCSYLEIRDVRARGGDWLTRTDKVSMILRLPESRDALSKQLGSKLRSQIKRADREDSDVRVGGSELLDAFYGVFAENMRDLGTPVYPKKFFRTILARFPTNTLLVVINHQGRPAAAGFLVLNGAYAEIPWAGCRAAAKPLSFNMKLYWEVLGACIERGCKSFDFGRSTLDSGTFKFKKQWGAQPLQLHWHRWERNAQPNQANIMSHSRLMRVATSVWQRMPMPVANFLGPWVSASLPW